MSDVSPSKNQNLINKRVFTHEELRLGLPQKVFVALLALWGMTALVLFFYLPWALAVLGSLVFGGVVFIPAYLIHEDDPTAASVWLRSLIAASALTTTSITRRRVLLLHTDGDRPVITSLTEGSKEC